MRHSQIFTTGEETCHFCQAQTCLGFGHYFDQNYVAALLHTLTQTVVVGTRS
jgi:hypothetical protein